MEASCPISGWVTMGIQVGIPEVLQPHLLCLIESPIDIVDNRLIRIDLDKFPLYLIECLESIKVFVMGGLDFSKLK